MMTPISRGQQQASDAVGQEPDLTGLKERTEGDAYCGESKKLMKALK